MAPDSSDAVTSGDEPFVVEIHWFDNRDRTDLGIHVVEDDVTGPHLFE